MKVFITICNILLLLLNSQPFAQSPTPDEVFGAKFKEEAARHVQYLAGLGVRDAGSRNEAKAVDYIKKYLKEIGLKVKVEPFKFESFILNKALLMLGQERIEPTLIGFNPYTGERVIKGETVWVNPEASREEIQKLEGEGKILISAPPARFFQLAFKKPKAIVFVSGKDFARLSELKDKISELIVEGEVKKYRSANVVASLIPKSGIEREIILSAHLDSADGPGADDNASGVAVLLQLAKYFKSIEGQLSCRIKFVALGAEEVGMIGSKVYVEKRQQELKNCELVFNMDTIGGSKGIYVEMRGGIEGASKEKGRSQIPEELSQKVTTDSGGKWRLVHPSLMLFASCVPAWLRDAIETTGKELGYEINPSYMMGSDHRVFAQAGIPATDIAISGNKHHSPEDTPEQVNLESLQKAARIVAEVVKKTMKRFESM